MSASKVLWLRNVSEDITQEEMLSLVTPFGQVAYLVLVPKNQQAFIEMSTLEQAAAVIQYTQTNPFQIKGKTIPVLYSKSQELNRSPAPYTSSSSHDQPHSGEHILVLTIYNPMFPITVDVLHKILSPYGNVLRIVIFTKNGIQALAEFDNPMSAALAKQALDGKDIYDGCCTLRIAYSKIPNLNVRVNNDKTRDYTNSSLPNGAGISPQPQMMGGAPNPGFPGGFQGMMPQQGMNMMAGMGQMGLPMGNLGNLGGNPLAMAAMNPMMAMNPMAMGMGAMGMGSMAQQQGLSNALMSQMARAPPPTMQHGGMGGMGGNLGPNMGQSMGQSMGQNLGDFMGGNMGHGLGDYMGGNVGQNMQMGPMGGNMGGMGGPEGSKTVLIVYNVPERFTCDNLFNLFCMYGNVVKIKVISKMKKGIALVQMQTNMQADLAQQSLHHTPLFGQLLQVAYSKHAYIADGRPPYPGALDNIPMDSPDGVPDDLGNPTKDYSNSPLNRFTRPSTTLKNCHRHSNVLYFSNAPLPVSEDRLAAVFAEQGAPVPRQVKFFDLSSKRPGDTQAPNKRVGLADWDDEQSAAEAAALANNVMIDGCTLKLSFSSNTIH